jgi:hypothetical protein
MNARGAMKAASTSKAARLQSNKSAQLCERPGTLLITSQPCETSELVTDVESDEQELTKHGATVA